MRWGKTALCSLAVVATALLGTAPAAATGHSGGAPAADARAPRPDAPPLTLVSQTPWVTPDPAVVQRVARDRGLRGTGERAPREHDVLFTARQRVPASAGDQWHTRRHGARARHRHSGHECGRRPDGLGLRHRAARRPRHTSIERCRCVRARQHGRSTSACTPLTGDLRRRLSRLGRPVAAGLDDARRPVHDVPHLSGGRAGDRRGRAAPRRRRSAGRRTSRAPTTIAAAP